MYLPSDTVFATNQCWHYCNQYVLIYFILSPYSKQCLIASSLTSNDNALAENFFSILKTECIYRTKLKSFEEARNVIDEYIYIFTIIKEFRQNKTDTDGITMSVCKWLNLILQKSFLCCPYKMVRFNHFGLAFLFVLQGLKFIQQFFKQLHGVFDGFCRCHVYACAFQEVDGIFAVPFGQEVQICIDGRLAFVQNFSGERNGCTVSCCILIYIEGVVEMGDTRPFDIDFGIDDDIFAKVFDVQVTINFVHAFPCEGFAFFCHGMGDFFEFCEHGLAEQCAAELF